MDQVREGGLSHRENQAMSHLFLVTSPVGIEDKRMKGRGTTASKDHDVQCTLSEYDAQFPSQGA